MDLDDPRLAPFRALPSGAARTGPGRDLFVVEGALAVARLLTSDLEVEAVVCTPSQRGRLAIPAGVAVFEASKTELAALTGFEFHRGVLACARRPATRASLTEDERSRLRDRPRLRVLVAEQLADPRNLGAVIRNAAAFAVDLVIADLRGADPYSRLAIRAGVGNVFRLPLLVSEDLPRTVGELAAELGAEVVAATPRADAVELDRFVVPDRLILLVGNEGVGLSASLLELATGAVRIPIASESDSINVAAATAVLLYAVGCGGHAEHASVEKRNA
jgi:tRNA G18 (ribose-2'-O)-methylase SpoU